MRTFGYDEGMRLAQLPGDDPERQRALAEAALAGEIVGEPEYKSPLEEAFTDSLFPGMSK